MFIASSWITLAILSGLTSNLFNYLSRYLLKDEKDPTAFGWFFEFGRVILFGLFTIIDYKFIINQQSIILLTLLGVSEIITLYLYMKMHAFTQLSISTILSRTRLLWVPIIAFFLIQEALQPIEYVGIVILFLGMAIIVSPKKWFVDKGMLYSNSANFMIAFNLVLTKMVLPFTSNSFFNFITMIPPIIIFPLFMKQARKRLSVMMQTNLPLKLFTIVVNVVSMYLYVFALRLGDVSKVTAIYQSTMIVAVLSGIIFLKERDMIAQKIIGSIIVLAGVLLLTAL